MDEPPRQGKDIFLAALEKIEPTARAAYLDEACGGDAALRERVEALLRAHDESQNPLERPAAGVGPTELQLPELEQPGMRIGLYKLMEKIGEGGFGLVFVAEQQQPVRRRVALKVIKPGMDTREIIARFEAERQALALMDHPHIARVLDAGATETGRPYFVMELVRGVPITDYCDQHQLTPRERLELFVTVCQAVQHAHQKGVIHRDLKPTNVLVTLHDGKPFAKVIDFGVAKAINQQLTERTIYTRFAQLIGTPLYMSPEQAEMSTLDIDTRSDIYSLGVLLYELLTGTTPFEQKRFSQAALDEWRRIVREEEPPAPSQRLSHSETLASVAAQRRTEPARLSRLVRGELDWIVMKALEKDRNRRYETAAGFARDVERYLADEPVEASPPSAVYRLKKIVRKHAVTLSTLAAFVAVLLTATTLCIWWAIRATHAERDAIDLKSAADGARVAAETAKATADKALAAEERARKEAQTHAIRIAAEFYEQQISAGRNPNEGALRMARWLREIPDFAMPWREAATLRMLDFGQQFAPLAPTPRVDGFDLKNVSLSGDGRFQVGKSTKDHLEVYSFPAQQHLASLSLDGRSPGEWNLHGEHTLWAISADLLAARVWSLPELPGPGASLTSERPIWEILLSRDGRYCVTKEAVDKTFNQEKGVDEYRDLRVTVWKIIGGDKAVKQGAIDRESLSDFQGEIALSPDGKWLAAKAEKRLVVFATDDVRQTRDFTLPASSFGNLLFSPSGTYFVVAQGEHVFWWSANDWQRIEPICRGRDLNSYGHNFLSDDFFSGCYGVLGPRMCFRRGEAIAQDVWAQAAVGDLLLTSDGDVYRWGSSKPLAKPAGRRFAPEAARFAVGGRFLKLDSEVVDLATELNVFKGRDPAFIQCDGLAWVAPSNMSMMGPLNADLALYPQRPGDFDPRMLELWLQVVLRGALDEADQFKAWDEATWQTSREELAQRAVKLGQFAFPGAVAEDRLYWLREEARRAASDAREGDAGQQAIELTDRLIREEPIWQSFDLQARLMAELDRKADSIGAELDAARVGGAAYWPQNINHDNHLLARQRGRPAAEYELLLCWLDERQRAGHPPKAVGMAAGWTLNVHALRSMALYRLGRFAEALEEIDSVGKDDAEGQMIRALCLVALGQTEAARAVYQASQAGNDADGPYSPSPYIDESADLEPILPVLMGAGARKKP